MEDKGFRSGFMTAVFMIIGIAVVFLVGKSVMPSVGEAFVLESVSEFSENASDDTGSATESSTISSAVSSTPVSSMPVISSSFSSTSPTAEVSSDSSAGIADSSPETQSAVSSETAPASSEPYVSSSESTAADQSIVSQPESTSSASEQENSVPPASESGVININTATAHELQRLNGIGEVKARAIIDYREQNGGFSSVDELINVKGIGEKTLEKIRADITV